MVDLRSAWGYGSIVLCVIVLMVISVLPIVRDGKTARRRMALVVYSMFSVLVFLLVTRAYSVFIAGASSAVFLETGLQQSMAALAITALIEGVVINLPMKSVFFRAMLPAVLNICGLYFVLAPIGGGIINIVWFFIFSGALAFYVVVTELYETMTSTMSAALRLTDDGRRSEILRDIRDEFNGFLKLAAQGFVALGASVGVSMSILFRDGGPAWRSTLNQMTAARMVAGFAMVTLGLSIWVLRPYLDSFLRVRIHYQKLVTQIPPRR